VLNLVFSNSLVLIMFLRSRW